jgi:hypothetical protein
VPSDLAISEMAGDVEFVWSDLGGTVDHYEAWRSSEPYFAPGDGGSVQVGAGILPTGGLVSYTDLDSHLGDPATNDYHLVLAVDGIGQMTPLSRWTGAFDFAVEPGGSWADTSAGRSQRPLLRGDSSGRWRPRVAGVEARGGVWVWVSGGGGE